MFCLVPWNDKTPGFAENWPLWILYPAICSLKKKTLCLIISMLRRRLWCCQNPSLFFLWVWKLFFKPSFMWISEFLELLYCSGLFLQDNKRNIDVLLKECFIVTPQTFRLNLYLQISLPVNSQLIIFCTIFSVPSDYAIFSQNIKNKQKELLFSRT